MYTNTVTSTTSQQLYRDRETVVINRFLCFPLEGPVTAKPEKKKKSDFCDFRSEQEENR